MSAAAWLHRGAPWAWRLLLRSASPAVAAGASLAVAAGGGARGSLAASSLTKPRPALLLRVRPPGSPWGLGTAVAAAAASSSRRLLSSSDEGAPRRPAASSERGGAGAERRGYAELVGGLLGRSRPNNKTGPPYRVVVAAA